MFDYRLEHLFSYTATLRAPPEVIGPVPEGLRANFYVTGGKIEGPRLRGKLPAVGGDWMLLRRDGVCILDVRATLETDDGALIEIAYGGVGDLGEDGYQRFVDNRLPKTMALRTAPRLRTAHPEYLWLNRLQCVSIGEADFERFEVAYDVYALR